MELASARSWRAAVGRTCVFGLLAAAPSCCALFCPPPPPLEADLSTPGRAYDSFKKAVEQDNADVEFRCLSRKLKDEQGISWTKYRIGRGQFMSAHKEELRLFLSSELQGVRFSEDRKYAELELSSAGSMGKFILINEPEYRITTEEPPPNSASDVPTRFEGATIPVDRLVVRDASGRKLVVSLDPQAEGWPSDRPISEFIVRNQWRFLDVLNITNAPFPAGDAKASGDKPKP